MNDTPSESSNTATTTTKPQKRCFIISPIADTSTDERAFIRWKADYLRHNVIRPILEDLGYQRVARFDEIAVNGWITMEMIDILATWEMAVAVLDGNNANCCYELGIRHSWVMPCVVLCPATRPGQHTLPFDLKDVTAVIHPTLQQDAAAPRQGIPWPQETLESVKDELRMRLVGAQSPPSPRNIFQPGLDRRSVPFGLRLIFELKREALLSLKHPLTLFRSEYKRDFEVNTDDAGARAKLLEPVTAYKKIFDMKCYAFELIVDDKLSTLKDTPACLTLCAQMKEISQKIDQLARDLLTKPIDQVTPEQVDAQLLLIKTQIDTCISLTTQ